MTLSAGELSAILPLLIPAMGACLLPIASMDKDQDTVKWVRGAMFFIALFCLAGGFFFLCRLWSTGAQPSYGALRMDRLGQFAGGGAMKAFRGKHPAHGFDNRRPPLMATEFYTRLAHRHTLVLRW